MKTICLNMIVKNEKLVIQRCLNSVKQIIDYWVIVDTGSRDGTQQIIRELLQDIPGELHETDWVNFETNRNQALQLARKKSDYILFIDADETLEFLDVFNKNKLNKDFYFALKKGQSVECQTTLLVKNTPGWKWKDVLHEYITNSHPMYGDTLNQIFINCSSKDGHRSQDPEKVLKDIEILKKAINNDPANRRYVFYLAQSYGNAKEFSLSVEYYKKRISMGGNEDEVFWSLYCVASLQERLEMDFQTIIKDYCQAYQFHPHRAEPLYGSACYFQSLGMNILGYLVAKQGIALTIPQRSMKIQKWIYDYGLLLKFAELAQSIGKTQESIETYQYIILKKECPQSIKNQIRSQLNC